MKAPIQTEKCADEQGYVFSDSHFFRLAFVCRFVPERWSRMLYVYVARVVGIGAEMPAPDNKNCGWLYKAVLAPFKIICRYAERRRGASPPIVAGQCHGAARHAPSAAFPEAGQRRACREHTAAAARRVECQSLCGCLDFAAKDVPRM